MVYYGYEDPKGTGVTPSNVCITLNLFFARIMKEHCIFIEAGLSRKDEAVADQVRKFHRDYNSLLTKAVGIAGSVVSKKALESQQFITPYTERAERLTSYFTGIPIDSAITVREKAIVPWGGAPVPADIYEGVKALNESSLELTQRLADFEKLLLTSVEQCRIFTANYPGELKHMYDETEHYLKDLRRVAKLEQTIRHGSLAEEMEFWNHIMAEHNYATAGRLDPGEKKLIEKSAGFGNQFEKLVADGKTEPIQQVKDKSLEAVQQLQAFQTENVKRLMDCGIKSILYPLRMDHHIRETAHLKFILEAAGRIKT